MHAHKTSQHMTGTQTYRAAGADDGAFLAILRWCSINAGPNAASRIIKLRCANVTRISQRVER